MRNEIRNALQEEAGQGMTEYIIIVALIAIAAIGVITLFGEQIRELFGKSAEALSGKTTVTRTAKTYKIDHKNLATYGKNNKSNWN